MKSIALGRTLRLRRAWEIVWRGSRGWTLAGFGLVVVQGVLPLVSIYLLKLVVDGVTAGFAAPAAAKTAAFGKVTLWIGFLAGAALLTALFNLISAHVRDAQIQTTTDYVHSLIHAKSVEVDLAYYEDPRYYDTLHRAQQEAPYRPASIVSHLLRMGQSLVSLSGVIAILVSIHWAVAAVLVLTALPGLAVKVRYSRRFHSWHKKRTPKERIALYLHRVLTEDQYAKEIRLFDLGAAFRDRYRDIRALLRAERLAFGLRRSLAELAAQSLSILALVGALAFTARAAVLGEISLGSLVMYFQAFQRGQGFLQELLAGMAGLYDDSLFLGHLEDFLELRPTIVDPPAPRPVPHFLSKGIIFENVRFRYPGAERPALDEISLSLRPGTVTALVGHSGSGKTTLAKLLCRLYDPELGTVLLDGTDYRQFRPRELRRLFAVVLQDSARYFLTVRENVGLSGGAMDADAPRVEAAARLSGADEFIRRLPAGYETPLGKLFERGEDLSVGEWQKIALARAFYRDSPVIVLDEPMNALDAEAEEEVFRAFRELATGRTVLLISHRFSTVCSADLIHVLDAGRIIESGTHDSLMALRGTYARLFNLQASRYRDNP